MTTKPTSSVCEPRFRTADPVGVPGAWFDQAAVDKVLKFGRFCRHTKGRWAGRPIEFEPWQVEHFIAPLFGWKHPDGRRIRRKGFLEVPKKNGKSTMASVLGLYLEGPDGEPGAEVYAAAAAKDQARIVFEPCRLMVERSPALASRYHKLANTIVYPSTDSMFRVISADANMQDGLNVHGYVVDEVHRHKSRDLIDILDYGTAARDQPLGLLITTAGDDDDTSIYAEMHDYCIKVANGIVDDPTFYGVIFAADPDDDWRDEATWEKSNPSLDVTVSREYLRGKAAEAEASPAKLNSFLRFHQNVRAKRTSRLIALDVWDASAGSIDETTFAGRECVGGISLSRLAGLAAVVWDFVADGRHELVWRLFIPEAAVPGLDVDTEGQASAWIRRGFLRQTRGNAVDYAAVKKQILADEQLFDVVEMVVNRRGAAQLAQELEDEGIVINEITPGISLAPATQELERLLASSSYVHGGNPVVRWVIDGMTAKQDAEGNAWPEQGKSVTPIAPLIAALMALDRQIRREATPSDEPMVAWGS